MSLQFKEQDFQLQAVDAAVRCFGGQPIKTNCFTLGRSRDIIRKTPEYFEAKTVFTNDRNDLRSLEQLKIYCAREHFKTITNGDIKFDVITNYQKLLELVKVIYKTHRDIGNIEQNNLCVLSAYVFKKIEMC